MRNYQISILVYNISHQLVSHKKIMKSLILIAFIVILAASADDGDWVDTYEIPIGFLVQPFFAGYLNITSSQAYYYTYFPSQGNPTKDPLLVRISAGPGCSSLYSNFYSKGPFVFKPNTKQFEVNKDNWNQQANLLFIEGPAGVGYSTGTDTQYSDQRMAMQFYFSILKFYQKFPELKDQDLYLSGEQYAGITIPRMAELIVMMNRNPLTPAWQKIKLRGFILNNPCTLGDQCQKVNEYTQYTVQFLKNHYFISTQVYEDYKTHCTLRTQQCIKVQQKIQSNFLTTGADLRNLYKQCVNQEGDIRCFDHIGIDWFLNLPQVKKQMHASDNITWKMCNPDIQSKFKRDDQGSFKIYHRLLTEQNNLRIWILSGSLSAEIPILGTKKWVQELKMDLGLPTTRIWEPWIFNNTINAGDVEQMRGLTFISLRSAGYHMWNDQPEIGLHIIDSFLKGNPL